MIYLDTHVVLWLLACPERVPERLRRTVAWGEPRISPIVGLELAGMYEDGRLRDPAEEVLERARRFGLKMGGRPFEELASKAWSLTWTRDPFDRVIAATAMADDLPLLTADRRMLEHCPVAEWD